MDKLVKQSSLEKRKKKEVTILPLEMLNDVAQWATMNVEAATFQFAIATPIHQRLTDKPIKFKKKESPSQLH